MKNLLATEIPDACMKGLLGVIRKVQIPQDV
eukprot:CAMPEP_0114506204 /NCGR_PEP_ID=MMETSP0109-20121206/11296_1 /TAXON_ID=29199 /ORGANISM="Chlorarachnion reptans, Strain CCCM449" /LENGTH=30 /DNA_ID= /DNA_START= /DNA_END= /DNA_ORIENTATION=